MAQVSTRIGLGRATPAMVAVTVLNLVLAALAFRAGLPGLVVALLVVAAAVSLGFAFVHPDRVVALDEDDDPSRKVGDRAE